MVELRLLNTIEDKPLLSLPVVFTGTIEGCKQYALGQGYYWLSKAHYLFGGYFVHQETGDCLLPS